MKRIQKIKDYLKREKLDAVLISSVSHIEYLTSYFNFSKEERDGYLFITKDENYLITNILYAEAFKNKKWDFKLCEVSAKSRTSDILKKIKNDQKIKKIAIEEDNINVREYKNIKNSFKNIVNFDFPDFRISKDSEEVRLIAEACSLGDKIFEEICKKIKPGISEKEIAQEMKLLAVKNGADISFDSTIAFGKNSAVPHHGVTDKKLTGEGEFVLMDFGMKVDGYCSDMTRTVFLGKPKNDQVKIYEAVLGSQKAAVDYIAKCLSKKQMPRSSDIFKAADGFITKMGYPNIPHGLGHGIGLEVHEYPHLSSGVDSKLDNGMIFSIEPGIYISKFGGVRIEDLYVIDNWKLKELTKSPKKLTIING